MRKITSILCILLFLLNKSIGQSVGIGITAPDPSAILHLNSNAKGFLLPSMASFERTAIVSPAEGLLLHDFNTKSIWFRTSANWTELVTKSNNLWQENGGDIYRLSGNVAIGLTSSGNRLHVHNSLSNFNFLRITNDGSGNLASDGLLLGANGANASLMNMENGIFVIGTNNDSALFLSNDANHPRLGIGVSSPLAALDVTHTGTAGSTARFNGNNGQPMYASIFENNIYRGYWGSYAGNAEDVDLGTGATNNTGKLHLTIQAVPKLTINNIGNVGIGTVNPPSNTKLFVTSDSLHTVHFTSTNSTANSSILKVEQTFSGVDYFAAGIDVFQNYIQGRGRGLVINAGYIGAEIYSSNIFGASQNYGVISTSTSDADDWGIYAVANGSSPTGTKIAVYGNATGGATRWAFYGIGNSFLSGGTWQTSDERFKKNILPIQNASDKLLQLIPSQYVFDTKQFSFMGLPEETQLGFLAGNMQQVFPELVRKVSAYKERPIPDKHNEHIEFNAVNYTGLIPVLTQAINEHTTEINKLKALLEEYKTLLIAQQKLINELKPTR